MMCFTASALRSAGLNEALSEKLGWWRDPLTRLGSNWLFVPIKLECWEKLGISQEADWLGCWVNSEKLWQRPGVLLKIHRRYETHRMESIWRLLEISPAECRVTHHHWRLYESVLLDLRILTMDSWCRRVIEIRSTLWGFANSQRVSR